MNHPFDSSFVKWTAGIWISISCFIANCDWMPHNLAWLNYLKEILDRGFGAIIYATVYLCSVWAVVMAARILWGLVTGAYRKNGL